MAEAKKPQKLSLDEYVDRFENFDLEKTRTATPDEVLEFRQNVNSEYLERQILKAVAEARYFGLSWQKIGDTLNLSADLAQQKFQYAIKIFDGAFGSSPSCF